MVNKEIVEIDNKLRAIIEKHSIMAHSIKIKIYPESCTIIKKLYTDKYMLTINCPTCKKEQTIVLSLLEDNQMPMFIDKLLEQMNYFRDNYCEDKCKEFVKEDMR